MGYLYLAIKIPQLITTALLMNMVTNLKFMLFGALTHLGIFKSPPDDDDHHHFNSTNTNNRDPSTNYILILDASSPSLVPIPVHVVTASIKNKVPVLPYGDFLDRFGGEAESVCTVCLDSVDRSHPIRQLTNCNHIFHKDCLDTWVDQGQVTCPLCRSMLLSPKKFSIYSSSAAAGDGDLVANIVSQGVGVGSS